MIATVYALGHVGGNHINPAVTLGLAVTGKFPWSQVPGYIAAQVVGAIVGAAAIIGVLGHKASDVGLGVASYGPASAGSQAFTAEFVGTFILVFTIFGVIHRKAAAGFAGVAIGLVVFAAIIPVAPATGASINPARTFGPMLVQQIAGGTVKWEQLPVYLVAELLAGVARGPGLRASSRTPRPTAPSAEGIDLADPEPAVTHGHGLTPTHTTRERDAMKKLINDPNDVVAEALLGIEAAHPDLRVDHQQQDHLPRRRARGPARSASSPAAARATSRCTAASSGSACSTRPAPVRCSPRRCPTRCSPPPSSSTAAPASCTSSRTTPAT